MMSGKKREQRIDGIFLPKEKKQRIQRARSILSVTAPIVNAISIHSLVVL